MALEFRREALTEAEASLLAWQFSGSDGGHPYLAQLWSSIASAWDHAAAGRVEAQQFLERLGVTGAFGAELAVYKRFKGTEGEHYWLDILQRAGLEDRRKRSEVPVTERRKRAAPKPGGAA